jgi:pimeloyl-ACP methyl ester carboxylesterase
MESRKKRRIIKFSAIGLGIILVIYIGLSIFGAVQAMEIPRLPLEDSPTSVGLEYEDVAFTSRDDGVLLKGWFLPGGGEHAVIIVHGGFQHRVDETVNTLWLAHDLVAKEYDVLLFDLRGRGESEGKGLTLSNIDRDIGGAVDYIKSRGYSAESIYIIGYCSGAASSCIFASQNDVGALVLDGCFTEVTGMVKRQAEIMGIPTFLVDFFVPGVFVMSKLIYSYDLVNAIDVIADVDCAVFFIHEENDELISLEEMQALYQLAPNPANQFWEVSDAAHSESYKTHPAEYIEKVDDFFSTKAADAAQ